MPVMFCYIDPFVMKQQVIKLGPNTTELLYCGSIDEVSDYMASEYSFNGPYDRIVLKGSLAETVADQIRQHAMVKYSNRKEIEIEVLK